MSEETKDNDIDPAAADAAVKEETKDNDNDPAAADTAVEEETKDNDPDASDAAVEEERKDNDHDNDPAAAAAAVEMIDLLASASADATSVLKKHNFSTVLHERLQSCNPTPSLLQLAGFFRAQSALLVRQAKALEELASLQEVVTEGLEDTSDVLFRGNISHWAGKAYSLMEESHDKLDSIEEVLVPMYNISKRNKLIKEPTAKKGTTMYNLFFKDYYSSISVPPTVFPAAEVHLYRMREVQILWKALDEEDKQVYKDRLNEMKKEDAAEQERRWAKKRKLYA